MVKSTRPPRPARDPASPPAVPPPGWPEVLVTFHFQLKATVSQPDGTRHMELNDIPSVCSDGLDWLEARHKLQDSLLAKLRS